MNLAEIFEIDDETNIELISQLTQIGYLTTKYKIFYYHPLHWRPETLEDWYDNTLYSCACNSFESFVPLSDEAKRMYEEDQ